MALYLGIDTSNYTTSVAVYDSQTNEVVQAKRLLPVAPSQKGLRQSDAVFLHTKQISDMFSKLHFDKDKYKAIGVSTKPRDVEGSYMPCFLVGKSVAEILSQVLDIPLHTFSHQEGHIVAGLFSAGRMDLIGKSFLAFHLSGGTTEALLVQKGQEKPFQIRCVASSLDLKAGQAIDRIGVMMGLPFPAGPEMERLASLSKRTFSIKVAMKGPNCCLSGVENQCQKMLSSGYSKEDVANYCLSYIQTALDYMTEALLKEYGEKDVLYVGGVMSNQKIRTFIEKKYHASFADPIFSADNAAGIAVLSYLVSEVL